MLCFAAPPPSPPARVDVSWVLDEELGPRRKRLAREAIPAEADIAPFPDKRLLAAKAFLEEEIGRAPRQVEALDAETSREVTQAARVVVIQKNELLRAKVKAMQEMVQR